MGIEHYFLRAVPDGEGDWYHQGQPGLVHTLRARARGRYSDALVNHLCRVIQRRALPLLVDIGGEIQGRQLEILHSCTHAILLYKDDSEQEKWQSILKSARLQFLAELQSVQNAGEIVKPGEIPLRGRISGLERDPGLRKNGAAFRALLEVTANLLDLPPQHMRERHWANSPYPVLDENRLAEEIGVEMDGRYARWQPADIPSLLRLIRPAPLALYGRGPVWLAAGVAAHLLPQPMAVFDIRFGWVEVPPVYPGCSKRLLCRLRPWPGMDADWLEIDPSESWLEVEDLSLDISPCKAGLGISGRLPRWAYAALARHLADRLAWLAVDDPGAGRAIVVYSRTSAPAAGDCLPRPAQA